MYNGSTYPTLCARCSLWLWIKFLHKVEGDHNRSSLGVRRNQHLNMRPKESKERRESLCATILCLQRRRPDIGLRRRLHISLCNFLPLDINFKLCSCYSILPGFRYMPFIRSPTTNRDCPSILLKCKRIYMKGVIFKCWSISQIPTSTVEHSEDGFCHKLATSCGGGGGLCFDDCLGWNMSGLSVPNHSCLGGGGGEASVGPLVPWQQLHLMVKNVYVQLWKPYTAKT